MLVSSGVCMKRNGQHCETFCTFSLRIQILVHVGKNYRKDHGLTTLVKTDKTHNHHFYINVVQNVNFQKKSWSLLLYRDFAGVFFVPFYFLYKHIFNFLVEQYFNIYMGNNPLKLQSWGKSQIFTKRSILNKIQGSRYTRAGFATKSKMTKEEMDAS